MKEAVKRHQELNELCRRNTAQAQMRQRKKYDEKILQAKSYAVSQHVWVFEGDEKTTQEVARTVPDHGSTPAGTVLPLEYGEGSAL